MINEKYAHKFCKDDISKIENYEEAINDKMQTWDLHHRLELTLDGEFALTAAQLKMHDMYYNRPYYELIFLTRAEHTRLHMKGKNLSEEHRRKISEAKKGRTASDEARRKLSESRKGKHGFWKDKHLSEEHRRKLSEAQKGRTVSEERRKKISEAAKRRWARKRELLSHRELA